MNHCGKCQEHQCHWCFPPIIHNCPCAACKYRRELDAATDAAEIEFAKPLPKVL